jgi:hypothetical protein
MRVKNNRIERECVTVLPDGRYAIQHDAPGNYRLIWLKTITGDLGEKDRGLFGKRMLYYKIGNGWRAFAFLNDDNSLQIHWKFASIWTVKQKESIRSAVLAISQDPERARNLYATLEKKGSQ